MKWFKSSVATAAIVAVASGPLAPVFAPSAAAQEARDQQSLEDLVTQDRPSWPPCPRRNISSTRSSTNSSRRWRSIPTRCWRRFSSPRPFRCRSSRPTACSPRARACQRRRAFRQDRRARSGTRASWSCSPASRPSSSAWPPTSTGPSGSAPPWSRQDADVLAAVQRKRAEALDTGWLAEQRGPGRRADRRPDLHPARRSRGRLRPELRSVARLHHGADGGALHRAAQQSASPTRSSPAPSPSAPRCSSPSSSATTTTTTTDRGWNDYWDRSEPIDWRDRQFYPRPP